MDELVNELIRSSSNRIDSAMDTPISSTPGTPSLGHPISLPGPSSVLSGRLSRQSDAASDRYSLGTTLVQSQNGATESVIERYAAVVISMHCSNVLVHFIVSIREMTARFVPDLIDIEQELFELPQKVCMWSLCS